MTIRATRKDEEVEEVERVYGYYKQQIVHQVHHFYLTGEIGEAIHYIDMVHQIRMAQQGEVVVIHLNTLGGDLGTGVQIMNAIEACMGHVICIIEGECHSLGTLIFLAADEFIVHDNCMMMFHNFSSGTFGKGHEQLSQLDATVKWFTTLARKKYIPFMSEEEFQAILSGQDMWIHSDEIRERLLAMVEAAAKEDEEAEEPTPAPAPKKKRAARKRS